MTIGNLEFEQFRAFLEKTCGILLVDNKQYLVSSRLNKLMELQGIPFGCLLTIPQHEKQNVNERLSTAR